MGKLLFILLGLIPFLAPAQDVDTTSCLHIRGVLVDYATHKPLAGARLSARTKNKLVRVAVSKDSGRFSGTLTCETTALLVERTGYRSQTIPVQLSADVTNKFMTLLIPMVPVDRQRSDTPYLQTEQTDYVQYEHSSSQSVPDSTQSQHNTLMVVDAIGNKPLSATVCFFFTKSGDKRCLGTNTKGWLKVDFRERDIVALEVNATGYQPYAGNLIVDQLDGRSLTHTIRMQRELTLLTVDAPTATRCELSTPTQTILLSTLAGDRGQYTSYDAEARNYELTIYYPRQKVHQSVRLYPGLNYVAASPPRISPVSVPVNSNKEVLRNVIVSGMTASVVRLRPDSIPMIYFEQGSHVLRPDSQQVLEQVVNYMKAHPDYVLQIVGHSDNVGNPEINRTLSQYRASVTATYLTRRGISDRQLTKEGIGSKQPMVRNDTEENRALNRRVSLKFITAQ